MPVLHAIVLGITQGLSEFLPISSSGHLVIVPWLFGWDELTKSPELNQTFDVALHVGTFAAVVAYFRRDIARLVASGLTAARHRQIEGVDQRVAVLLMVASLPAATVGLVLDRLLEGHSGGFILIGAMLIIFGLVLLVADRLTGSREVSAFSFRDATLMGFAQALALQPGVSRSGATISAGRLLGFDRDAATRISFLMSIPITGGLGLYKAVDVFALGDGLPPGFAVPFFVGTVASAITGFIAVWALLHFLRSRSFAPFVVYRVILGAAVIGIALIR